MEFEAVPVKFKPQKGCFSLQRYRMDMHERIRQLRQEKKWSQVELAEKIGVHQKQISAYERGANNPSTEVLLKLARIFDVTVDYLAAHESQSRTDFKDRQLLDYFRKIDEFPENERKVVKEILDLVVVKQKLKELSGT
jgi:transcriptional regulator with XRE-family HTH domain